MLMIEASNFPVTPDDQDGGTFNLFVDGDTGLIVAKKNIRGSSLAPPIEGALERKMTVRQISDGLAKFLARFPSS